MRPATVPEVHANLEARLAALAGISATGATRTVCLGDVVGHDAGPAGRIALLREADARCIGRDHDRAAAGSITIEGCGATAARAPAWTRARLELDDLACLAGLPPQAAVPGDLVAVHGALAAGGGCGRTHLDSDERRLRRFASLAAYPPRTRVCAFGHTHQRGVFELGGGRARVSALDGDAVFMRRDARHLPKPGPVGEPRGGERRATYFIPDAGARAATVRRVARDTGAAGAKTRAAGLALRTVPAPPAPAPAAC